MVTEVILHFPLMLIAGIWVKTKNWTSDADFPDRLSICIFGAAQSYSNELYLCDMLSLVNTKLNLKNNLELD